MSAAVQEQVAAASFNPDDASGLVDNVRATIKKVGVDYFTAKNGNKFVNVDVTYAPAGGNEITEHYMLGGADQWAPNAKKSGAIPTQEGGRIWNKSDVFKLMKSIVDAGFPKNKLGADLTVLEGLDVHINRVTGDGTYTDKEGKERTRTTLLVTKIYGEAKAAAGKPAAKATAASAAPVSGDNDEYAMELIVKLVSEKGSLPVSGLPAAAFIQITRDKKAAIREAVTARLKDEAFLAGLAEQGLIGFDGKTVSAAV